MTLNHLQKSSLVQSAVDQLRATIEAGDWRIGEKIPVEPELAKQLGVSRNTVREAVRVLVHAGMLDTRQGAGTFVRAAVDPAQTLRRVDQAPLGERVAIRIMLEAEAARLAAEHRTDADLAAMRAALQARATHVQAGRPAGVESFVDIDAQFHSAVIASAHNTALLHLYRYCAGTVTDTIRQTRLNHALPEPSQADHAAVLNAIEAQDPQAAAAASRALLAGTLAQLTATPGAA